MKRPSYRDALYWLVANDDTQFLEYAPDSGLGSMSVAAVFAADMFGVTDEKIRADLIRERAKQKRPVMRKEQ
jgi:hypothetical protein